VNKQLEKFAQINLMKINNQKAKSNIIQENTVQIVTNTEDDKIGKRIRNIFSKISSSLNISEEQKEDIINLITKNIVKRNKSFEQIYEDTAKFLSKNMTNDALKSYFQKNFRKLLRKIKEEQAESVAKDKAFNIKINLNESEEKMQEKAQLEALKREVLNFIDNQKIPENFRETLEYPLE
jgi:hypothetical protein